MSGANSRRWYQDRWILFVISIPAMAVVMGLTTIYLAVFGGDTLVRDNYYKEGLAINRELDGEMLAQQLGITVQLQIDNKAGVVDVTLAGNLDFPQQLHLAILHPTRAEKDRDIVLNQAVTVSDSGSLSHSGSVQYTGVIAPAISGHYHLQLASASQGWRLKGYRELLPGQAISLP